MDAPIYLRWAILYSLFVCVPGIQSAVLIDKVIRIQPIQVCSDDGALCADTNRILFESETRKILAQAGIHIEFLPWNKFQGTPWLNLGVSLFQDTYSIFTLANAPGHGQHPDPKVINLWFVRSIGNGGYYGHSWQSVPGVVERNGIAVADNVFASSGGADRLDVIAHELGHNLGLDHNTLGAGAVENLMSPGRQVPASGADIYPDGAGWDYLNLDQISQARSTSYAVEPVILVHPANQIAAAGLDVAFTILASGTSPLRYRWWFNRTNLLAWATNDTLLLTNVQPARGGSYHAVVSNIYGTATSTVATLIIDSDEDGLPDDWELAQGFDPHSGADALLDADGDGMTNREEYRAGTNPRDPLSNSRVELLTPSALSNSTAAISFQAIKGRSYRVQYQDRLDNGLWLTLTSVPPATVDQRLTITEPIGGPRSQRFYRVSSPALP